MAIRVVIVPLDSSEDAQRAVPIAGAIARRLDARVLPVTSSFGWGQTDPSSELAVFTESIKGITDPPRVYDRFAPNAIGELARATPDSLVCMATHGREGLARLSGSVAEEVLRQVRTLVLLVGPRSADDPTAATGPALICVDGSPVSNAILPVAIDWLHATRQAARLVSVVRPDENVDAAGAALATLVAGLPADITGQVTSTVLEGDEAAPAIVDFARAEQTPLIFMATHGRSGLSRITAGSVTMRVVRDAPCPVLTTRPHPLPA